MKKSIHISAIAIIILLFSITAIAQKAETKSDIIFRAIQDELTRTMSDLNHPEAGKPFFVGFYVTEGTFMNSSATLGAITTSFSRKIVSTSYRFMFGSYDLNDENFEETPPKEMVFPRKISAPLECDYAGIRRVLWNAADQSCKSASRNYVTKKKYFEKNPSQKPDFPDYIKQEPVIMELAQIANMPASVQTDSLVRALSYIFRKYENISSSDVSFNLVNCNLYLINTEGTRLRIPFCFASVDISAQITNGGGENLSGSLSFVSMEPFDLIHDKTIAGKLNMLADYLVDVAKAPKLEDDYNGPVLFTGTTSVPQVMEALFAGKDALIASREEVKNTPVYRKTLPQNTNTTESKIGKRFMPEAFSVTLKPKLDSYKGIKLFGKNLVDYEGTVSPDEIRLVENGILKDLLRNRVPSSKTATISNGCLLPNISPSGIYSSVEPGVVFFSSSQAKTNDELKKALLASAREKGLDFALIVRPVVYDANNTSSAYYMVSVANGSETLLHPLSVRSGGGKLINHIAGCSNQEIVQNTLNNNQSGMSGSSVFGTPASIILPDAILFSDMSAEALDASVDKSLLPQRDE